ncbi:AAA family ATPase [Phreatobacter sp. AB_2022a]|uniref:AAA family ATPase n=1 Tax=Phreatobacter sp. AB_2022a TaxID=3003134 RepID=UPI00228709C1|nr:MerR family transcriptional regulator [Phreatobacter sp. AB_2022a]MCZ0736248.1 MerR family transcriptional regulator [Phreatobacter sp. AB_2022a]
MLAGRPGDLEPALAAHQARLEREVGNLSTALARLREIRASLAQGHLPVIGELARLVAPTMAAVVAFDLPWPWGGERFVLRDIKPLTYVIGPRGSGKTRLARCLADALPGAVFVDLDRAVDGAAAARARIAADPALATRVEATLAWLTEDGATPSDALLALIAALEAREPAFMVVDMVEQGLDQPSQEALIAHLRRRGPDHPPLFLMTRSSAILDLSAIGAAEAILFCPANHSPPTLVAPYPGAPGYEAVATCLASPSVRARLGAA